MLYVTKFKSQTCYNNTCSIASPLHITPRSDGVLIDVSIHDVIRGVAGLSHITVTNHQIIHSTSDVVHLHTVDNVWINTSQIQGKWSHPRERASTSSEIDHTLQWSYLMAKPDT